MAITALIENGKVVDTGANNSTTINKDGNVAIAKEGNEDMFLNLLVAEMQYQDPLQPTSNTEWIGQYATFSQVEKMSSMASEIQQLQGSALVGQQVIIKTTNAVSGETSYVSGAVDYMYVEEGQVYLSVNNELYKIEELDTVVNSEYMDALTVAQTFEAMVDKMPSESALSLADEQLITTAREAYDSMSDYQKTFVKEDKLKTFLTLEEKMKVLKQLEEIVEDALENVDKEESSSENGESNDSNGEEGSKGDE